MLNNFFKVLDVNLYFDMSSNKVCCINKDRDCQVIIHEDIDDFISKLKEMYDFHIKHLHSDTKAKSK